MVQVLQKSMEKKEERKCLTKAGLRKSDLNPNPNGRKHWRKSLTKAERRKSDSRQEPEVVADAEVGPSKGPSKPPLPKYARKGMKGTRDIVIHSDNSNELKIVLSPAERVTTLKDRALDQHVPRCHRLD